MNHTIEKKVTKKVEDDKKLLQEAEDLPKEYFFSAGLEILWKPNK
jgi:hypothetical protein